MKIIDLLEAIQKHRADNIEFCIMNEDGIAVKLELAINDGIFVYEFRDKGGGPTDTIILGLTNASS